MGESGGEEILLQVHIKRKDIATVTTIGFDEFQRKLKSKPSEIRKRASDEAFAAAKEWAALAKRSAAKDTGGLAQSVFAAKLKEGSSEVTVNKEYAPFIEWGTKKKRKVPADLVNYANSIPYVKRGDYYDFLNNILDWVKRKGIGMASLSQTNTVRRRFGQKAVTKKDRLLDVAQAIAFSIIRHGVKGSPFFFIHKDRINQGLKVRMEKVIS